MVSVTSCIIHFPSSLSDTCQHKIWEVVSASMQWAAETEMIGLGCSVKDIDQRSLRFKGDNHHFAVLLWRHHKPWLLTIFGKQHLVTGTILSIQPWKENHTHHFWIFGGSWSWSVPSFDTKKWVLPSSEGFVIRRCFPFIATSLALTSSVCLKHSPVGW